MIQNHREKLIYEIDNCEEPALVLHFAVLAIFTILTQNMLHACGRHVSVIISFLKTLLKPEEIEQIELYHGEICLLSITYSIFILKLYYLVINVT